MSERLHLYKDSQREAELTRKIRGASELVWLTESLTCLTSCLFKNKRTALGTGIDSSAASVVSLELFPAFTGVFSGDYWRPVSRLGEAMQRDRVLRRIRQGESDPKQIATVLVKYLDLLAPNQVGDALRVPERLAGSFGADDRLSLIQAVQQSVATHDAPQPTEKPADERKRRWEERKKIVAFFMESQLMAQQARRSKTFIFEEAAYRIADWALGAVVVMGTAKAINDWARNSTMSGLIGLIDDTFYIGTIFFSPALKKILNILSSENRICSSNEFYSKVRDRYSDVAEHQAREHWQALHRRR